MVELEFKPMFWSYSYCISSAQLIERAQLMFLMFPCTDELYYGIFKERYWMSYFSVLSTLITSDAMHFSRKDNRNQKMDYSFLGQGNRTFLISRNKLMLSTCPINSYYSETEHYLLFHFTYTKKIQKYFSK